MITHAGPQAAISLAKQLATKYQMAQGGDLGELVSQLMQEIEPVLQLEGVNHAEYLDQVRGQVNLESTTTADERRKAFLQALHSSLIARREAL